MAPYSDWILGHPNTTSPDDECVKMAADGRWNNVGCFDTKAYVCQIPWATAKSNFLKDKTWLNKFHGSRGFMVLVSSCFHIVKWVTYFVYIQSSSIEYKE